MANSTGNKQDLEAILLTGMTPGEERAFCLGVRAGKHYAAIQVSQMIRDFGATAAKAIDTHMQ